jgi:histidine triad (HIT) family protein
MSQTSQDCLFCKFVARVITPDVVGETEHSLAFRDISPQAPTHVLVVQADAVELADVVLLARAVAQAEGLDTGYRLVFNTGERAGQSVFHAHLHLLGGRDMEWPPG